MYTGRSFVERVFKLNKQQTRKFQFFWHGTAQRVGEFFTDLELFKLKATSYFETSGITQRRISSQTRILVYTTGFK
jgi:hypothetical protein